MSQLILCVGVDLIYPVYQPNFSAESHSMVFGTYLLDRIAHVEPDVAIRVFMHWQARLEARHASLDKDTIAVFYACVNRVLEAQLASNIRSTTIAAVNPATSVVEAAIDLLRVASQHPATLFAENAPNSISLCTKLVSQLGLELGLRSAHMLENRDATGPIVYLVCSVVSKFLNLLTALKAAGYDPNDFNLISRVHVSYLLLVPASCALVVCSGVLPTRGRGIIAVVRGLLGECNKILSELPDGENGSLRDVWRDIADSVDTASKVRIPGLQHNVATFAEVAMKSLRESDYVNVVGPQLNQLIPEVMESFSEGPKLSSTGRKGVYSELANMRRYSEDEFGVVSEDALLQVRNDAIAVLSVSLDALTAA